MVKTIELLIGGWHGNSRLRVTMRFLFRKFGAGEVRQNLTQQDQFNTEKMPLAATLMRESHQNSLDARLGAAEPVRLRVAYVPADPTHQSRWKEILAPLKPHLAASKVEMDGIDLAMPDFLLIEDFGTIGLTGEYRDNVDGNFEYFWRHVGSSNKNSDRGGSWGLGKLVFPVSSRIRTFFGLTTRSDDQATLLMGQSVLATHRLPGEDGEYAPHAFFAIEGKAGFQLPLSGEPQIEDLRDAMQFRRRGETGLSIAIPFPRDDMRDPIGFVPCVLDNYFFPILSGELEVDIGGQELSARNFEAVVAKYGAERLRNDRLIAFIKDINRRRRDAAAVKVDPKAVANEFKDAFAEPVISDLKERFERGELIHVRAQINLRTKSGVQEEGHFDLFLQRAPDDAPQACLTPLMVRGALTIPNETGGLKNRRVFAAFVAGEGPVSRFLRDAENPAHTSWTGTAEKLVRNWQSPAKRLNEIRYSLRRLYEHFDQGSHQVDENAFADLISLILEGGKKLNGKPSPTKPAGIPQIVPAPKPFAIVSRRGGFTVKGHAATLPASEAAPRIEVRAAYDIPSGDPFKRFSRHDFDFGLRQDVTITTTGARVVTPEPNMIVVEVLQPKFSVEVMGFDTNRDVVVSAILQA